MSSRLRWATSAWVVVCLGCATQPGGEVVELGAGALSARLAEQVVLTDAALGSLPIEVGSWARASKQSSPDARLQAGAWSRVGDRVERSLPHGVERWEEQDGRLALSWRLDRRPGGRGALRVPVRVAGYDAAVAESGEALLLRAGPDADLELEQLPEGTLGVPVDGLAAWDAEGRDLPIRLVDQPGGFAVEVDDRDAVYPIEIDPVFSHARQNFEPVGRGLTGSDLRLADFNQDGYDDLIIGDPWNDDIANNAGQLFLFWGGPLGYAETPDWVFQGTGETDFTGMSLAIGDFDDDGWIDIAAGQHGNDAVGNGSGRALLFRNQGAAPYFGTGPDWTHDGDVDDDVCGSALATGDLNGDGIDDLAVACEGADLTPELLGEGEVRLFFGGQAAVGGLGAAPDVLLSGDQANEDFGSDVAIGDWNGDGYGDVAVGSDEWEAAPGSDREGRVQVFYGSASGPDTTADWERAGDQLNMQLGGQVHALPDLDGDGIEDLAIAARAADRQYANEGRIELFAGGPAGLASEAWWAWWGGEDGATAGGKTSSAIRGGRAVDATPLPDGGHLLAVSAWAYDTPQNQAGRLAVFEVAADGEVFETYPRVELFGDAVQDRLGYSLGFGDVNGDGVADLVSGNHTQTSIGSTIEVHPGPFEGSDSPLAVAGVIDATVGYGSDLPNQLRANFYTVDEPTTIGRISQWLDAPGDSETLSDVQWAIYSATDLNENYTRELLVEGQIDGADGWHDSPPIAFELQPGLFYGVAVWSASSVTPGRIEDVPYPEDLPGVGSLVGCLSGSSSGGLISGFINDPDEAYAFLQRLVISEDADGDGVTAVHDCNDDDASIFPGADDSADDCIDNDCDGLIDEDGAADLDGDGWSAFCGDCDDSDPLVGVEGDEDVCDGLDNDCDGLVDGGLLSIYEAPGRALRDNALTTYAVWVSGNGVVESITMELDITHTWAPDLDVTLVAPDGTRVVLFTDIGLSFDEDFVDMVLDDAAASSITEAPAPFTGSWRPEQPLAGFAGVAAGGWWRLEIDDDAGADVGTLDEWTLDITTAAGDVDGDGWSVCDDCDDEEPTANPVAVEICDEIDNDCDTEIDEALSTDADGDGFYAPGSCAQPADDCDDGDASVYPAAPELCDGLDNDCDGASDEGLDVDDDGDGHFVEGSCSSPADDCDDSDPTVHGGYPEICDGIDNDCNGLADDGLSSDADGDGLTAVGSCEGSGDDCDDSDPTVFAGAPELCDGLDNNCDGLVDEGLSDDLDGDGHFVPGSCASPADDCDDNNPVVYTGFAELCDGFDNDCNGIVDDGLSTDADGDGSTAPGSCEGDGADCDDLDASRFPGAMEVCNSLDDDCDGVADEGLSTDADGDGRFAIGACASPADDCDDSNAMVYPGFPELCDGIDNDCDGVADNGLDTDADGDGVTAPGSCTGGADDCDDSDPTRYPGAPELCDEADNDCDFTADEGLSFDEDGDGSTAPGSCGGDGADCDDFDPSVNPAAADICDGVDNNCDGVADEGLDTDADGDGYTTADSCGGTRDDCDDSAATVFPGAEELCDTLDNNCDGVTDEGFEDSDGNGVLDCLEEDGDGDGFTTSGGDCDDSDPTRFPGATEVCNGLDDDCDGALPADEADVDGDGFSACSDDCDDTDPLSYPGADEVCDGLDNDCDGSIGDDEADLDEDGFLGCEDDCDDEDPDTYPGALELCDGLDNDCDREVPDDEADLDADGQAACEGDCDDTDPDTYEGAPELCDGIDNDCDGGIGNELDDADADGFTPCDEDCDDTDAARFPGAEELCDGLDNDCDGVIPADEEDADADGFAPCGDEADCDDTDELVFPGADEQCNGLDDDCDGALAEIEADADGDGQSTCEGDCDDSDLTAREGLPEICDDIVDNDCDGEVDEDCTGCSCSSAGTRSQGRGGLWLAGLLVAALGLRRRR